MEKKNSICIAIHKTWKQRTKLRLFVDQRGLFDITDDEPPISTSLHGYEEEALNSLLDKNMFRPISPGAYLQGLAVERFDHREKTALALALARCLMAFFDKNLERAFCNWNAENVFFMRSARPHGEPPWWYILVRSLSPGFKYPQVHDKVGPGNPILLSFAKLLLEISNGEKIQLDVDLHNFHKNIGNWAQMCAYVEEARQDGNSFYLQAVQGCLYLHMHFNKTDFGDSSGTAMREAIYEQIVRNLEKELHPEGLKRKRPESSTEPNQSKKRNIMGSIEPHDDQTVDLAWQNTKNALTNLPSRRNTNYSQPSGTFYSNSNMTSFSGHNGPGGLSQKLYVDHLLLLFTHFFT